VRGIRSIRYRYTAGDGVGVKVAVRGRGTYDYAPSSPAAAVIGADAASSEL
jgi:hypothetical protein